MYVPNVIVPDVIDPDVIDIIGLIGKKVENGEKLSEKLFRETLKEHEETRRKNAVLYEVVENGEARRITDPEEYRKFDEMMKKYSREPPVIEYMKKRMKW